jgi:hypothetical protein
MKDVALKILGESGLSNALMHILYSLVDTDLDFKTVQALYVAYRAADIVERPDDIVLRMKPFYETSEYHFDPAHAAEQLEGLLKSLEGRLSPEDLSHKSVAELQAELEDYMRTSLAASASVEHVYNEQLWRQLEDEEVREELHFRFMEKYVRELKAEDHAKAVSVVTDYILEKQYYSLDKWEDRGRDLLATLVE